jgi:O-antigen ligase
MMSILKEKFPIIYRAIIVGFVLLLSSLMAFQSLKLIQGNSRITLFGFLAFLGLIGLLIFLKSPPLGLIVLIIADFIIPFSLGTGTQTKLNVTILLIPFLTGVGILDWIMKRQPTQLFNSKTTWPLFMLFVIVVLAFINGLLSWNAFAQRASLTSELGEVALFFFSILAFLLVGSLIPEIRWLKMLVWVFLGLGSIYILSLFNSGVGNLVSRFFPPGISGSVLWIWIIALAFSQGVFNHQLKPLSRLLLLLLVCVALYHGIFMNRGWTSGWLPALVAIWIIVWVGAPRFGLILTILIALGFVIFHQQLVSLVMIGDNTYSLDTRLLAWKILIEIIRVSPILGLGPANYYFYTPLFPILGYAVRFNSHNNYVDIVAQIGLLGLAAYLWFFWETAKLGFRLRPIAHEGFERAYVYGTIGGLAGMLVAGMLGDWVIPFVYNVGFDGFRASVLGWLFLGGLIVLERSYKKNTTTTSMVNIE